MILAAASFDTLPFPQEVGGGRQIYSVCLPPPTSSWNGSAAIVTDVRIGQLVGRAEAAGALDQLGEDGVGFSGGDAVEV